MCINENWDGVWYHVQMNESEKCFIAEGWQFVMLKMTSSELNILKWLNVLNPLLLPTDAHNVKKRRVIKTF